MNGIITIIQNKRVSLPFIFGKYSFPKMQKLFRGKLSLFHIFQDVHFTKAHLETNRKLGVCHLQRVQSFIQDNKFNNATIVRHTHTSNEAPMLPSLKLALQIAKDEKADFHLWLEDDAIIFDPYCYCWATTLASGDVGLYRNTNVKEMVNTAYFLSTSEYDHRYKLLLEEYKSGMEISNSNKGKWDEYKPKGSLIEHVAWRAARNPVLLDSTCATRHHPYGNHTSTREDVEKWLKKTFPEISKEDLELLKLDYES